MKVENDNIYSQEYVFRKSYKNKRILFTDLVSETCLNPEIYINLFKKGDFKRGKR